MNLLIYINIYNIYYILDFFQVEDKYPNIFPNGIAHTIYRWMNKIYLLFNYICIFIFIVYVSINKLIHMPLLN